MYKSIALRFAKAAIAGALAQAALISVNNIQTWADLSSALNNIVLSLTVGAVSGILMAAEKWASWTEQPPQLG